MKLYTVPSFVPFLSYTAVPSTLSEAIRSPVSFVAVPDIVLSYPLFAMVPRRRLAELWRQFRARRPARTAAVAERGRIGSGCRTIAPGDGPSSNLCALTGWHQLLSRSD